jgi:hypothetical protein
MSDGAPFELPGCVNKQNRNEAEICAVLGYYTALCCVCLRTFRDVSVPFSRVNRPRRTLDREDGADTLSRNVGKQLPHDAA